MALNCLFYLLGSDTAGECSQIRVTPDTETGIWSGFLNSMANPIASAKMKQE